ncbi:SCF E3 ubiquitin ligase complex F-box protein grrA [Punctularia strigosozonata HHB-11173 SS5]|uniref:SCF E3 ubiquitin ligase complex F-box protein grrA n=1 Tax=Punctularia strigosozonata (strain HHB-11173) TaxID=741275 RepID=UPI00044175F9|nr:SCF E3 ubiquitin ligase complex F-box protein grrA [Punctularia strigosozonata HHB-11173 SS5]EIN10895.1 SCF E3 ubiquitin ligase complex F-box protein grrA [Punctularia strigosozonata HHB-11173 SS5]
MGKDQQGGAYRGCVARHHSNIHERAIVSWSLSLSSLHFTPPPPSQLKQDQTTMKIINRLPEPHEYQYVQQLILDQPSQAITDEALSEVLRKCIHLQSVTLTGLGRELTDATVIVLVQSAWQLKDVDLSGCTSLSDLAIIELAAHRFRGQGGVRVHPLRSIKLNGIRGLTDPAIGALAETFGAGLREVELCELGLLTASSVRDLWGFGKRLRRVRLAGCRHLTEEAFPSARWPIVGPDDESESEARDEPGHVRPKTWFDMMPDLLLEFRLPSLTFLDVSGCEKITNAVIGGVVGHAPRIQTLLVAGCSLLDDGALAIVSRLGSHLEVLSLSHLKRITDAGVVWLTYGCKRLVNVDVSHCAKLTDLAVTEFGCQPELQSLNVAKVRKVTDNAVLFLAEHAPKLERLNLAHCAGVRRDAVEVLLRRQRGLSYLNVTGVVPAFGERAFAQMSDPMQSAVPLAFSGERLRALRTFLDEEARRRLEAEERNVPFVPRTDIDEEDLR